MQVAKYIGFQKRVVKLSAYLPPLFETVNIAENNETMKLDSLEEFYVANLIKESLKVYITRVIFQMAKKEGR